MLPSLTHDGAITSFSKTLTLIETSFNEIVPLASIALTPNL